MEIAEACTGWTEQEARNHALPEIFRIVNETTRAEVENPVSRVQRTGMVCDLANHTNLIRKDGSEISIDDSGAPIRDSNGKMIGTVLVFRDVTESKRSERELQESEERSRFIERNAEVGYWDWDIVQDRLHWGPVCKQLFGIPQEEEMTYRRFLAAAHPEDRERTDQAVRECLAGSGAYEVDFRCVWPDGTVHWMRAKGNAHFENGQAIRMAGVALDVSSSKKDTEALAASESRLATFVDLIPALAWMANEDGGIFWYNQRWYEFTGTTEEQMQGWGWQTVHDPEVLPRVMERWTESIRLGKPFEMVFPLRGADGVFRSFMTRIVPAKDAAGKVTRWFGTNTEVDELQSTKEALAKSQERLELAQDAGRLAIWHLDLATDKFSWTGNVMSLYGRTAEQMASAEAVSSCIYPEDREATIDAALLAIKNRTAINREFRVVWPDQSIHWVGGRGRAIYGPDGEAVAMVGTNWDITRVKLAEEALRKAEKLAVAGRLAATIAHEINNPLEAVTNLLYLVRSNLQDGEVREYAVAAEEELARVSLIVNQSLRFHRQSTVPDQETLSSILDSAVAIYKSRLATSEIELRRDYRDRHPVRCYSSELRQVFGNLIGNAFDAVRQDGIICLRTREARDVRSGEPGIRVTVADSGHGMDAGTLQRISEPFFTTKGINGTGLGLWISRDILQKHHARLRIRSRKGDDWSGTVFSVFLPLHAIKETARPASGEMGRLGLHGPPDTPEAAQL
jgi:PAS domain S-box-containing protein